MTARHIFAVLLAILAVLALMATLAFGYEGFIAVRQGGWGFEVEMGKGIARVDCFLAATATFVLSVLAYFVWPPSRN